MTNIEEFLESDKRNFRKKGKKEQKKTPLFSGVLIILCRAMIFYVFGMLRLKDLNRIKALYPVPVRLNM